MNIQTKTVYIAKDGEEFDNEKDCLDHENVLDDTIYIVVRKDWKNREFHVISAHTDKSDADRDARMVTSGVVKSLILNRKIP